MQSTFEELREDIMTIKFSRDLSYAELTVKLAEVLVWYAERADEDYNRHKLQSNDDPREWSDHKCRKVAEKIHNEVGYGFKKIKRIKALRVLTIKQYENIETWGLRAIKEWIERVFDNAGNIRI